MGKLVSLIIFIFFVCFLPANAYAVSVVINNSPSSIGSDPFTVSVTITGASSGTNYVRVDLYKEGTTNYFGETFTGSEWYSGADGAHYFPVAITQENTSTVQARIGDTIPKEYDGTGIYKLRVRRYTAGGNYNNDEAKASAVTVALVFPTVTISPSNTPKPTKMPTPTKVPSPTKIPTPTKTPTPTKSQTPMKSVPTAYVAPTEIEDTGQDASKDIASREALPTSILGARSVANAQPQSKKTAQKNANVLIKDSSNQSPFVSIAIAVGIVLLLSCGILVYRTFKRNSEI